MQEKCQKMTGWLFYKIHRIKFNEWEQTVRCDKNAPLQLEFCFLPHKWPGHIFTTLGWTKIKKKTNLFNLINLFFYLFFFWTPYFSESGKRHFQLASHLKSVADFSSLSENRRKKYFDVLIRQCRRRLHHRQRLQAPRNLIVSLIFEKVSRTVELVNFFGKKTARSFTFSQKVYFFKLEGRQRLKFEPFLLQCSPFDLLPLQPSWPPSSPPSRPRPRSTRRPCAACRNQRTWLPC